MLKIAQKNPFLLIFAQKCSNYETHFRIKFINIFI